MKCLVRVSGNPTRKYLTQNKWKEHDGLKNSFRFYVSVTMPSESLRRWLSKTQNERYYDTIIFLVNG